MLAVTALGARLATGGTAELYAYGEHQVLKLYWHGAAVEAAEREASRTEAARRAGAPAPAVHEVVLIDERPGVVFDRVEGPSMLERLAVDPAACEQLAAQLAELHVAIHSHGGTELPSQREHLLRRINLGPLPARMKAPALAAARRLPHGDVLCHGDFHPGNVLLSQRGAVVIDWFDATLGEAAGDLARTSLIMQYGKPPGTEPGPPEALRTAFVDAYLSHYARLSRAAFDALPQWLLPVAAARVAEPIAAGERNTLLRVIESLLAAA